MDVRFADHKLERLESDEAYHAGFPREVVRAFRRRMQEIRSAVDERLFYVWKSLHYEKLKGNRSHERSMRLNSQFRLILQIDKPTPRPGQLPPPHVVVVVKIEDYH